MQLTLYSANILIYFALNSSKPFFYKALKKSKNDHIESIYFYSVDIPIYSALKFK